MTVSQTTLLWIILGASGFALLFAIWLARWVLARDRGNALVTREALRRAGPGALASLPPMEQVYLTLDIDVLDPSCAPGTGCPEPGGVPFAELVDLVYSLRGLNVVAVDVMEVLPAVDVNDITSVAAAKLVRECTLAFGSR